MFWNQYFCVYDKPVSALDKVTPPDANQAWPDKIKYLKSFHGASYVEDRFDLMVDNASLSEVNFQIELSAQLALFQSYVNGYRLPIIGTYRSRREGGAGVDSSSFRLMV